MAPGSIQVEFIDVGQGLAVLIIAADGQAALFDGGPVDAGPAVLMELNKHGVKRLELLINSHPHEDHLGGLIDVLKNIPVSKIITNGQPHTTAVYERFLDAALATDAEYIEAALGSSFLLGGIVLQVYSPPLPQPAGDLNHNSLVLHFRWGEAGFLLMGDADQEAEMAILASGLDVRANVLQAGHHCSSKSTSRVFLQSVRPEYAVCSEGAGNSYGHPHAETLQALVDVGASVFRTDISGSIVFITDGANLSVQEEK